ncbi:hypothetical protein FHX42_005223 [Saccharopolyspora lacisalsi]|uniref:Uncharacterized protein n=1 Tax=Halosaccharopolyspora lacisalsi TaxID=1000566 RepID=A0A839E5B7_9PSEU|nr:hypothetical protein [Halosaccharopolyspora lacisalsi]MBA8827816.1 hypothetical protein [Halosaccharopolyspora lacisalsi]
MTDKFYTIPPGLHSQAVRAALAAECPGISEYCHFSNEAWCYRYIDHNNGEYLHLVRGATTGVAAEFFGSSRLWAQIREVALRVASAEVIAA